MSLKRPSHFALVPAAPPIPPEIELIDVTRLECVLDTGVALSFDLGKDDSAEDVDGMLVVRLGKRLIQIARSRILYTETRPEQIKRIVAPK